MTDAEMERWAATEVMGWKWYEPSDTELHPGFWIDDKEHSISYDWQPLTNLNHAWMVVEKMRELGWCGSMSWWDANWTASNSIHSVEFWRFNPDVNGPKIFDDNLCLAILKAARTAWEAVNF